MFDNVSRLLTIFYKIKFYLQNNFYFVSDRLSKPWDGLLGSWSRDLEPSLEGWDGSEQGLLLLYLPPHCISGYG